MTLPSDSGKLRDTVYSGAAPPHEAIDTIHGVSGHIEDKDSMCPSCVAYLRRLLYQLTLSGGVMNASELDVILGLLSKAEKILTRRRVTHDEKEYALHCIGRAKEILQK